ncbi:MAG: hypothetical protein Q8M03_02625 [Legionella sp.]|nr:hypothetical protein [Legionella sp.]
MKVTGTIELVQTAGRKDPFVQKKLERDYFLALKITDIDGMKITTVGSVFDALQPKFPSIKIGEEEVSKLFNTYTLLDGMEDVCHLSLGYFGDFRIDRNTANELDINKVDAAIENLHGKEISFEISGNPFQVVSTTKMNQDQIHTEADLAFAPAVGAGRDTILNLLPDQASQKFFAKTVESVFGEGFQLWNAQKKPVPFHITIAQAAQLNTKFANIQVVEKANEAGASCSM